MNEKILERYYRNLCGKYRSKETRKNYHKFAKKFLEWLSTEKNKNYENLISDDTQDYRAYCLDHYKINGNVIRLNAINNFVGFLGRRDLRITAPKSVQVNKTVLSDKELQRYINSAVTPLEKLIAIYQVDGLLRPSEFSNLRISLHDIENQILYLDDTKTGNNSVILTPRMIKSYNNYMKHRIPPKFPENKDYLIIIDKGSHHGLPITTRRPDFIYRHTKKIAAKGGFTRSVYPYLVKPSAITDGFNKQINPKILKRQARHKRIETTLRYDHTSDIMTKEYFNRVQRKLNIEDLTPEDKVKVWLDKLLSEEIDLKTFKTGLDCLLPKKDQGEDIGYV